jgi:hypothetical protein
VLRSSSGKEGQKGKSSGEGPGAERRCKHQITKSSVIVEKAEAAIASRCICIRIIALTDGDVANSCGMASPLAVQCEQDVD